MGKYKKHTNNITTIVILALFVLFCGSLVYVTAQQQAQTVNTRAEELSPANMYGKALDFPISPPPNSTAYVEVPNSESLNPQPNQTAFTVEAWVKPDFDFRDDWQFYTLPMRIVQKDNEATGYSVTYRLSYMFVKDEIGTYFRLFIFKVRGGQDCQHEYGVQNQIDVNRNEQTRWFHVAGVVDGNTLSLYEDGQLQGQISFPGGLCSSIFPLHLSRGSVPLYQMEGQVDEVRISNIARYTSNFPPPVAPFAPDLNTMALYHLDGNAYDASDNINHGTVNGLATFVESTVPNPYGLGTKQNE